ncbi:manganese ABC transporter ATP-binding protein [Rhodospirillum rubrum]|uniref:metal ABC transporter ATP-binding protein n=1 Tax=Rhodospirillum rubrum TaxID=1085 RepID=UPI0019083CF2|nr:metal ABC transporter ATP-binding protein [Rhodospirillum rubrum]MBK1663807.1 manganese ABC transporter ATP-binding protein [Rhodospirillum rubrum]MBK1675854.1 manganese ABC transporter ATP-binding protein [Rhodospirillum rubrum]
MSGPSIEISGLSLALGGTSILEDVALRVAPGAIQAVVGPNGGGKSSLVSALLGLMPHRGTIDIDWPGERPGVLAYVPQSLAFDPGLPMTVSDVLAVMCQRRPAFLGPARRLAGRYEQALERVGMAGKRHRRFGALSGGERQRVLLAQALIPDPDLVILDEPMTALDEAGAVIFEDVLAGFRQRGVTVLWVEHDLGAVRRLADHACGLNRAVLFNGPPSAVLAPERLLALFSAPSQRPLREARS